MFTMCEWHKNKTTENFTVSENIGHVDSLWEELTICCKRCALSFYDNSTSKMADLVAPHLSVRPCYTDN